MAGELVLVIDDSPTITKVVQLVLTKAGYQVQTAADGEQGLASVRSQRPDLILLDFVMPRMNGYQFCRELTADAKLRDIPVVLMSAKGDQVGERFVKVMGIVDYITKPFSPEAITAVVQHTINKYARRRADDHSGVIIAGSDEITGSGMDAQALREAEAARRQTPSEVRASLAQAVSARVATLFHLADAARDHGAGSNAAPIPTDPAAISDATKSALDDGTLQQILSNLGPHSFGGGVDDPV